MIRTSQPRSSRHAGTSAAKIQSRTVTQRTGRECLPASPSAGTVVVRAADLIFRGGGTVTAGNAVPSAGELAVFCRPVVTAPALARRDGSVAADGWLPDFAGLGELKRHLGDGVIEEIVAAAPAQRRLRKRERRRIMSYPLVIRLMIAMALMPDASYCEVRRGQGHDHRRREPHLRPGAAVGVPAAGHPGSMGLAGRHPTGPRQRRRGAAQRGGRGPRAAPQEPCPGHRGRGILHRHLAPRDPLHDIHPGHGLIITGRARPNTLSRSVAAGVRGSASAARPRRRKSTGSSHRMTIRRS
jgi:hypothetical protein